MADRNFTNREHQERPSIRSVPPTARGRGWHLSVAVPGGFRHPLAPVSTSEPPTLLPLLGINDEITPALERAVHPIALRAQAGDYAARDSLYIAFEPKLMRFVRRIRVPYALDGAVGIWERGDVLQEAYLAFIGLIAAWSPEIPFGRYVLANFPWRLRDAVHRGVGRRNVPPRAMGISMDEEDQSLPDPATSIAEQRATIEVLAMSFEPPLDDVLRLHILDNLSLTEMAVQMGISRRTITRYWETILIWLRATSGTGY